MPALGVELPKPPPMHSLWTNEKLTSHSSLRCLIYKTGTGLGFGNPAVGPTLFRVDWQWVEGFIYPSVRLQKNPLKLSLNFLICKRGMIISALPTTRQVVSIYQLLENPARTVPCHNECGFPEAVRQTLTKGFMRIQVATDRLNPKSRLSFVERLFESQAFVQLGLSEGQMLC